jgi:hypothetical protein
VISGSGQNNHAATFADWVLIALLVIVSGYSFVFIKEVLPQGTDVKIEVDGKPAYILPLSINRTVSVDGPAGKTIVEISNGKVRVKDSPCHNKLCVHQGWINKGAIVCLPNKVLVIISGPENKKEIDGITG